MKMEIKQKDIEYFLEDFEKSSVVEIVEGKEKENLHKIAEARGIKSKGSRDIGIIKGIWAFTEKANDNGARLPEKELLKVLPQLVGKPMSVNHNRKLVVGSYLDYRYIQKEKKIIFFATFYKSNFPKLWEDAKKLHKAKKLSSSFEIWSPQPARKIHSDKTYSLRQMEIAGGTLVYQDKDNKPAFKGADVLEMAVKESENLDLCYSSKYKESEIINSNEWKNSIEENLKKLEQEKNPLKDITCSNCNKIFETADATNIKCPECFAILNSEGTMIIPPQIFDFKINCPDCRTRNWTIVKNEENRSILKCNDCSKNYVVEFAIPEEPNELLSKVKFLYINHTSCPQCGNDIQISGISNINEHEATCQKCGLVFKVNSKETDKSRQIKSIAEYVKKEEEEMKIDNKETDKVEDETKVDENTEPKKEEDQPEEEVPEKVENPEEQKTDDENKETESPVEEKKEEVVAKSTVEQKTEDPIEIPQENNEAPLQDNSSEELNEEVQDETTEENLENSNNEEIKVSKNKKMLQVWKKRKEQYKKTRKLLDKAIVKIVELKKDQKQLQKASVEAKSNKEEIAKIKKDAEKKIDLYKASAQLIVARRTELGEYAEEIEDKDIIDDNVFEKVKLEMENAILRAKAKDTSDTISTVVGRDTDFYAKKREEINKKAFSSEDNG